MHVGYGVAFQNPENHLGDDEVYAEEMRLVDLAVDLGFESIWTVEHHFTDYTMCPDPVQLLTWLAARHPHVRLGTAVIVLPWHDPMRCAEQITMLDNLSGGRLVLGIGRGLARIEYEGFRVDMDTSRERFVEYAQMILEGLERGYLDHDGVFVTQPRRDLRPRPRHSFRGRTFAAAVSPESMPLMARLGVGLLIIPQKPWEVVRADMDSYTSVWAEVHGPDVPIPDPMISGFCYVDPDAARAQEMAYRFIGGYYGTVLKHYELEADPHKGVKGYEFYRNITRYIDRHGRDDAISNFVNLMPWGTPDQVLEKVAFIRDSIGMAGFNPNFSFAGMPYPDAEASIRLYAREVLPVLREWDSDFPEAPEPLELPAADLSPAGAR